MRPYLADKGSFTLISGVYGGTIGTTINHMVEGFLKAAAVELPRGVRIKFTGFTPVPAAEVALAIFEQSRIRSPGAFRNFTKPGIEILCRYPPGRAQLRRRAGSGANGMLFSLVELGKRLRNAFGLGLAGQAGGRERNDA